VSRGDQNCVLEKALCILICNAVDSSAREAAVMTEFFILFFLLRCKMYFFDLIVFIDLREVDDFKFVSDFF